MLYVSADIIFDGDHFLDGRKVLSLREDGSLEAIMDEDSVDPVKIKKLKGIVTPGFINAHCHTELSHLKNKIPQKTGLPAFGKQIIIQRKNFTTPEIKEQCLAADHEMRENGIVAVGDISNGPDSFEMKAGSDIHYHTFIELLALNPSRATAVLEDGINLLKSLNDYSLPGSLAPHAPYSTSKELIASIADFNIGHKYPSSIHNQESPDEVRFFKGEPSGFNDLYDFLKLDISWFKAPMISSLAWYMPSIGKQQTLLVHNTLTGENDIELTKHKNIYWCFCPSANLYIENSLPSFDLFLEQSKRICLGTDSLASNNALSIVKEANLLLQNSSFSVEDVLRMMTINGARALNIDDRFGKLIPGRNPGLNLIEVSGKQITFKRRLNPVSL
jgi:cytosine/adenosine deaminase-related metal-dependent hydrolase